MADGKVNWYEEDVELVVNDATDEIVTKLAFFVEGEAKVGAAVDTGFMRNAIYSITPLGSRRGQTWKSGRYKSRKTGQVSQHNLAPEASIEVSEAAVHAAAEYTIYNELREPFLYPALEKAQGEAPGVIQAVGRAKFG